MSLPLAVDAIWCPVLPIADEGLWLMTSVTIAKVDPLLNLGRCSCAPDEAHSHSNEVDHR